MNRCFHQQNDSFFETADAVKCIVTKPLIEISVCFTFFSCSIQEQQLYFCKYSNWNCSNTSASILNNSLCFAKRHMRKSNQCRFINNLNCSGNETFSQPIYVINCVKIDVVCGILSFKLAFSAKCSISSSSKPFHLPPFYNLFDPNVSSVISTQYKSNVNATINGLRSHLRHDLSQQWLMFTLLFSVSNRKK